MSETTLKLTRGLCIAAFVAAVVPIAGQGPEPSISLTVIRDPPTVKAGSPTIWIEVALTNITKSVINVPQLEPAGVYIRLDVRDSTGEPVGKTRFYREVTGDRTGKDAPASADPGVFDTLGRAAPPGPLQPGASAKHPFNLAWLFDLTQPGKYAIQAQEADPVSGAIVKSKVFTLTVQR